MALLLRLAGMLGKLLLRLALVLTLLFVGHWLLTRVWPELRRAADAIAQAPLVEQRLAELESALSAEAGGLQALEHNLTELGEAKVRALRLQLSELEQRMAQLNGERLAVQEELAAIGRERDEYCSSYNPFKRWMCRELEQRFAGSSERLAPSIAQLNTDVETATRAVDRAKESLDLLTDPARSPEDRAALLGDDAARLSLSLSVSRRRFEQLTHDASILRTQLVHLRSLEASVLGSLLREWRAVQWHLLGIALFVLALPVVQRTLSYFVLMPLITRWGAPIRLTRNPASTGLSFERAQRSLVIALGPGQCARARSPYARPVQGRTRSQLLYKWSAPFISYASGLRLLTRIDGGDSGAEVTLAAPSDPSSYLLRVDLAEHAGVVIRPRHLIGVLGEPRLRTHWRLFSLHAWCTWQLRYIVLEGAGSVVLEGHGDVVATDPKGKHTKLEQELVIGFDSALELSTARTEVFLPYLFGKTALVDDLFTGNGALFWQKAIRAPGGNAVSRSFDAIWSAVGKVLGF